MPLAKEPAHPLDKRELLHADPPDAKRIDAVASKLLDEGREGESVEYIEVTRNAELIARLTTAAKKKGSPFLLEQSQRLSGEIQDETAWRDIADAAQRAERHVDVVRAYSAAGLEAEAEEYRVVNCPDYDPFKPHNK